MTRWAASCAGWPTALVCPFNPFGYHRSDLDKVRRRRAADTALSSTMSERSTDPPLTPRAGERRGVIPPSCALDRGPAEFANLLVSMRGGTIKLDPQVTGACVIELEEDSAWVLRDKLTEWLR
jgi:hypothetical protein